MSKVITLENLEVFKQECDKAYASKEEIITATVDCSHKYEITGNTGDEHGLAIDDQQMLIKKIQGHSRRKSLNLFSLKPGTYAGVTLTYDSASGIYTFNGSSTGASILLNNSLPQGTKISFIAEVVSGTKTGAQNDISVMIDGTWIATDWVNTKTLSESISGCWMSADITFTKYQVKINVVEGTFNKDTMPPFQPYDNTLVNSNNTLISTGRNILNPDDFGAKCHTYDKSTGIATITVNQDTRKIFFENYYFAPNTQYTIILDAKTTNTVVHSNTTNLKVVYTDETSGGLIVGTNTTTGKSIKYIQREFFDGLTTTFNVNNCAIIKGANQDFEPYKQDIVQAPMLGEFDYYQEGKIVRQTSQIVTLNGSENWKIEEISPSKRFIVGLLNQYGGCLNDNYTINTTNNLGIENQTTGTTWTGTTTGISAEGDNLHLIIEGITTVEQLKEWLKNNNIQMVFRLATPTIEEYAMPSGYAVYNGGLQIQQGDVPYTITKQYNLSQKAQILANIEVDREQAKMIEENNQKFNLIPKFSHVDINLPETSMNGTLTEEEFKILQANDLNYIMFNKEIYMLSDKTHTIDTLTYSHVGYENHKHMLKTISVTVSTRAWILNTTEITSMGATSVTINQPSTATNGILTQEQINKLQANDLNYIIFNNEIYSLNDKTHTADTLTYSHVGFENGKHLLKTISITVSTRAWVLNTTSVVDSYEYRMFKINNPSGNISTSIKEIYIYTNKFDTDSRFQDFLQNAYDGDMNFSFPCIAITPTDTIINAQFFYDLNIDPSSYFVIFNDKTEYVAHQNLVVVESA